jgi:HEAT repeat protein
MPDAKTFLNRLQSDDAATRFAAWRSAGEAPPSTIPELGKLAASPQPGVSKAAREALSTMVHSVGKDPGVPNRAAVIKGLLEIASPSSALSVRVHALRLLSHIAGEDSVPMIAALLANAELREEAIYAIERIPGAAADRELLKAYESARDDFKPRVLAALGHRRVAAAATLCLQAMRSSTPEVAVAAVRAFGRIGTKPPAAEIPRIDETALSITQKTEAADALLRYADSQSRAGNAAEAMRVYRTALDRPEPHWQCAAIIGIARTGTPEAAAAIFPKLKSANRTVRITAENAWRSMAGASKA